MIAVFLLFLIGFSATNAIQFSVNSGLVSPQDTSNDDTPVMVLDAQYPGSCAEAVPSWGTSGVYKIQIAQSELKPFYVYCQVDPSGGPAWTIFQRRMDGSIDFYRNWKDYVEGFGNLNGEYFIGLEKLYAMTDLTINELWIELEDFENQTRYAKYSSFAISDDTKDYTLNLLGKYSGNAGDSFTAQAGQKFSTKDKKNDNYASGNCAQKFTGAWWYNACLVSNLNGQYLRGAYSQDKFAQGIDWNAWHGHYYSLKYAHMAIRPIKFTAKGVLL